MKLQVDLSRVDFRVTPVENIFLDTYLAQAPAEALRVYLYGWRAAYENPEGVLADKIMKDLNLTPDQLIEALSYWMDQGLVTESRGEDQPVFLFRSVLLHWQGFYDEDKKEEPLPEPEILGEEESQKRRALFQDLEDYLSQGRAYRVSLKENEIRLIQEILDRYPISPEYFLYAYQKAAEMSQTGSRSVHYLTAIVENWARFDGLVQKEDLDQFLSARKERAQRSESFRSQRKGSQKAPAGPKKSREEERAWIQSMLDRSKKRSLRGRGGLDPEELKEKDPKEDSDGSQ